MCGVIGFWSRQTETRDAARERLLSMASTLRHRGPDAAGAWYDTDSAIGLAHRRLSILDLSPAGEQPMESPSGRFVVSYNGEIYNHAELRSSAEARLGSIAWRGHSDTESLLASFDAIGVQPTIERCVGMFALAIWDRQERRLQLVRDRLGIKPLYVLRLRTGMAFASELQYARIDPDFDRELDPIALSEYFHRGCVPGPLSIYRHARKIEPGTIETFSAPDIDRSSLTRYWDANAVALAGVAHPFRGSEEEAIARLDALLHDAVAKRMVADVPVGAFLSGGIDSSAVVAMMTRTGGRVRTYSIGSEDARYDEGSDAERVAKHLGTEHTPLVATSEAARAVVPRLATMFDEPFADSSQVPTFLVSQLARRDVTVALSGDGGDELFGGYNRHLWAPTVWSVLSRVPARGRAGLARSLERIRPERLERFAGMTGVDRVIRAPGDKLAKLIGTLAVPSRDALYERLRDQCWREAPVARGAARLAVADVPLVRFSEWMMLRDVRSYLPDDILTKVDRASMAVSLEARVPLLDHRVVELAWSLPIELKIRGDVGKHVLRKVLSRYVPATLFERPKTGFGIPIGDWLRGPLRGWAEGMIDPGAMRSDGFLDVAAVQGTWADHLAGRTDGSARLWSVLMFQAWRGADASQVPSVTTLPGA
ncbi:MAG: asparagine synthase (glutamine-hydrolyzing) [Myxococcota bacterium]|nr:asparagine synthase (glutamine-hydrolyzing) [Myxococcota bacterium]